MKKIYNLDKLVCIKICDKTVNYEYVYKPFKKKFWNNQKGGFYCDNYHISDDTILEIIKDNNWLLLNNIIYHKPRVTLYFTNGTKTVRIFNTYKEACDFGIEISNNINIKLDIDMSKYTISQKK